MNAQIRRLAVALIVMIVALMGALTYQQFIFAPTLNAHPLNRRVTDAYWNQERGKIVTGDGALVLAQSLPVGTEPDVTYARNYPQGAKYAHITGYFPAAIRGQMTDLEKAAEPVLSGKADSQWMQRLQDLFTGAQPQAGNVSLTINPAVQDAMTAALSGKTGAAVALNPKTGEILGMASSPTFDPNALSGPDGNALQNTYNALVADPQKPLLNRAISELYPPGSTFKIVTTAALLSHGTVAADTIVDAPDSLDLPGTNVKLINFAGESCGNGQVPLHKAFALSCNTPFGALGMQLGGEPLQAQAKAFGFGTVPNVPLTGVASQFPPPEAPSFLANAAIGQQSVRVTPLQMAMVASAVANNGKVMTPYLINQELSSDFQVLKQYAPQVLSQAVSPEIAASIRQMMVEVVQSGTGKAAGIPGLNVAGKTGTAETGVGRGLDHWFVGFAPAEDPRIAVAIVVEDPQGVRGTGGTVAAPLARSILQAGVSQ